MVTESTRAWPPVPVGSETTDSIAARMISRLRPWIAITCRMESSGVTERAGSSDPIARITCGRHSVLPAAEEAAAEPERAVARLREAGARGDRARFQSRERGEGLEGRAGRIDGLDGAVEEGIVPPAAQLNPALLRDPGGEFVGIVVG